MMEKDIEKYFCNLVSAKGGKAIKGAGTGVAGFPDRIVLKPGGKIFFTELKAPGQKPRKLQVHVKYSSQNLKHQDRNHVNYKCM